MGKTKPMTILKEKAKKGGLKLNTHLPLRVTMFFCVI